MKTTPTFEFRAGEAISREYFGDLYEIAVVMTRTGKVQYFLSDLKAELDELGFAPVIGQYDDISDLFKRMKEIF